MLLSFDSLPLCLLLNFSAPSLIWFVELLVLIVDCLPVLRPLIEVHSGSTLPLLRLDVSKFRTYASSLIGRSEVVDGMLGSFFCGSITLFSVLIDHWLLNVLLFVANAEHRKLNGIFPIVQFILAK